MNTTGHTGPARPLGARNSDASIPTWVPPRATPPRALRTAELQARVLEVLEQRPYTYRDLALTTGETKARVQSAVGSLVAKGVVRRLDEGGIDEHGTAVYGRRELGTVTAECYAELPAVETLANCKGSLAADDDVHALPRESAPEEETVAGVHQPVEAALEALEGRLRAPSLHVEQLELKRATLARLAQLLDPSIAEVLLAIDDDYAQWARREGE